MWLLDLVGSGASDGHSLFATSDGIQILIRMMAEYVAASKEEGCEELHSQERQSGVYLFIFFFVFQSIFCP